MPFVLFIILWPLIEIALFVQIGGAIGLWPTLAIVVGTAVLGVWLMRRRGALAMADVQRSFEQMRDPTVPMAHGAFLMLSGVLLILPGFLTDALGLLFLLPPVRGVLLRAAGRRMSAQVRAGGAATGPDHAPHRYGRGAVIDGDYVDQTDAVGPRPTIAPDRPSSGWTRGPEAH